MKSNLLLNKINLIQIEYKTLLSTLLPKLKSQYFPEALDEINIFWFRYIKVIQLYLKSWLSGENSYVFTATMSMGVKDNEHLPFLLLGDKHIFDDPLSKHSEIRKNMPDGLDAEFLYKQIGDIAEDNIKLLENLHGEILILPLRILTQSEDFDSLHKFGEQIFVSLFNGINSLQDYYAKCTNFTDIMQFAREDIEHLVMFSEDDDVNISFEERFRIALAETQYMVDVTKSDSFNFFMFVFGNIQQAVDVIISCLEYNCIPFIRNLVTVHYVFLISENMLDIDHISALRFKMFVAFVVYQQFDRHKFADICLEDFLRINQSYNFNERLFRVLLENDIDEKNFLRSNAKQLIISELESFYDVLYNDRDVK